MLQKYVKQQYYENLRKFKYNGQNFSILYNWILGEIAQFVVDHIPKTIDNNQRILYFIIWLSIKFIFQSNV